MAPLTAAPDNQRVRMRWSRAPWVLYLATLLSAPLLGSVIAGSSPRIPEDCSGIGWGCSLYEWDRAAFMLLLYGFPYAAALGLVIAVLVLFQARALATATALVGAVVPWLFVLHIASRQSG